MLMVIDKSPVTNERVIWLPMVEEDGNSTMKISFTNVRTFSRFPFIWYQNASSALSDSVYRQLVVSLKKNYLKDNIDQELTDWFNFALLPDTTGNVESKKFDIAGVLLTAYAGYIVYGFRDENEKILWNMEPISMNEPTVVTESYHLNRYLNQYLYQQSALGAYTTEYAARNQTHIQNILKLFNERNPNQVNKLVCLPIQDFLNDASKNFIKEKSGEPIDLTDWALQNTVDRVALEDATLLDFEEIRHQFLTSKVEQQVLPEVKDTPKKTKVTRKKKEVKNETK